MTSTPPSPSPRVLGRWPNRILVWGLVLATVATVLLMVQGSDAFLEGLVAMAGFGLLLSGLPAVLFLYYSRRTPPPEVGRSARVSIWFSAVTLVLFGALLIAVGGTMGALLDQVIGVVIGVTGIVTIVQAVRFAPPLSGETRLGPGYSSVVGALLFLFVAVMVPKFACGCGEKSKTALLKSDLRNLVTAEDAFYVDHHRYAALPELVRDTVFFPTSGDSMVVVVDTSGWHARATHQDVPDVACIIWVGKPPTDGSTHGAREGEPRCGSP